MKKAAELLATTKLSVAEVAEQVGYMNQSKFASVFKNSLDYRHWNTGVQRIWKTGSYFGKAVRKYGVREIGKQCKHIHVLRFWPDCTGQNAC